MKKVLIVLLCVFMVFLMAACNKNNADPESATSSDTHKDEISVTTESQTSTSVTATGNAAGSSAKTTTTTGRNGSRTTTKPRTEQKTSTTTPSSVKENPKTTQNVGVQDSSYEDIVCEKTYGFQQVGFSLKGSNVLLNMTIPEHWKLEKNNNGYNIVKFARKIGSVTTSEKSNAESESVISEIAVGDITVTQSIERVSSGEEPSYTRTICYHFSDQHGNPKNILITVDYQEIDSTAVNTMMMKAKKSISLIGDGASVLQIQDNRNKILILGNSFVSTSSVGSILQTMCGSKLSVEAHSRGYASVVTYAQDTSMLQNIRSGRYSVVFMCGFYSYNDVLHLAKIVAACEDSNTQLALFPAHNESRVQSDDAAFMYPDVVMIDWKGEIDALISTGVNYYDFCIADAHAHSTPLAGYVGAHMIYRAIFNKIPQTTSFSQVSKSQIDLLGAYASTGAVGLSDKGAIYSIG